MLTSMDIFLRLLAGLACGGIIGLNRDLHHKPAGFRTFGLVGLGSALAVLAVVLAAGTAVSTDAVSRVIQGVLTGIGFLGAGVILHRIEDGRVAGLTTAAAIWLTAGLGVAAGVGQFTIVYIGLGLAMVALLVGGGIERFFERVLGRSEEDEPSP
jgi:putative Mg2+ transporter-C (MgtC) family protein